MQASGFMDQKVPLDICGVLVLLPTLIVLKKKKNKPNFEYLLWTFSGAVEINFK